MNKAEQKYLDFLDNCNNNINICGRKYPTCYILKAINPAAFRCPRLTQETGKD